MLGKLLKHEYRATFIPPVIICAVLALVSVCQTVLALFVDDSSQGALYLVMFVLSFFTSIMLTSAAVTTVYILAAVRFYSHIYGHEGYLTLMLPVSRTKLHLSQYIVSLTWVALCTAVGFLGIMLPFFALEIEGLTLYEALEFGSEQLTASDITSLALSALQTFAVYAISGAHMLSTVYFSLSLGQFFRKKRVLASILIFFGIYSVQYILNIIVTLVFTFSFMFEDVEALFSSSYLSSPPTFIITGILGGIFLTVQFILTNLILKKKVNLQ